MANKDKEIKAVYVKGRIPKLGQNNPTENRIVTSLDTTLIADQGGVMVVSKKIKLTEQFIPISNISCIEFSIPRDATSKKNSG